MIIILIKVSLLQAFLQKPFCHCIHGHANLLTANLAMPCWPILSQLALLIFLWPAKKPQLCMVKACFQAPGGSLDSCACVHRADTTSSPPIPGSTLAPASEPPSQCAGGFENIRPGSSNCAHVDRSAGNLLNGHSCFYCIGSAGASVSLAQPIGLVCITPQLDTGFTELLSVASLRFCYCLSGAALECRCCHSWHTVASDLWKGHFA